MYIWCEIISSAVWNFCNIFPVFLGVGSWVKIENIYYILCVDIGTFWVNFTTLGAVKTLGGVWDCSPLGALV